MSGNEKQDEIITANADTGDYADSTISGMKPKLPNRQIRAVFDDNTITVYQAYSAAIAEPAVAAQRLDASPTFSLDRMTWIKPSFMWMMYRSGFSYKDSRQERILALKLSRSCFEGLLSKASVNTGHGPASAGREDVQVRVQWDPERSLTLEKLDYRSIQIGIGRRLSKEWVQGDGITGITDVTDTARRMKKFLDEGDVDAARVLLPKEKIFPLPEHLKILLGIDLSE